MARQRSQTQAATADAAPHNSRTPADANRQAGGSRLFWLGSRLFVVAVLLGVLAFFAPQLIGSTGLWKSLLATAAPEVAPYINAKSLQLSWLAPIEIHGLVVRDPAGQPLAEVPLIRSRKSLLMIALNDRDFGTFDVQEPKARIVLRADGSNVEDLLAKLPKSEGKSASLGFGLALTKGMVELDDQIAGRQWQLDNLSVEIGSPAASDQPKSGKLATAVRPLAAGAAIGQLAGEFVWQQVAAEKSPLGAGQVKVTLQGVPTEVLEGALRRFASDIRPRGPLTLEAGGAWKDDGSMALVVSQLATPGISVAAPALLGTDQPIIAIASGLADVQVAGGQAIVRNLQLSTNLVAIAGKGAVAVRGLTASDAELTGQLNLAELARQMPATLRLKQDLQLASGLVEFSLASRSAQDARQWQGSLKTRDVRGVAAGRPIEFSQPVALGFAIRQTAAGPVIDRLIGEASFMRLEGRGSLAEGGIVANADLNRFVAELGRFVEWGQTQLAGTLASELRWKHDPAAGWIASAEVIVENFEAKAASIAPWKEPKLHLAAKVQGDLADSALAQINSGRLEVEAGPDQLDAELTQTVKSPSAASVWPIKFALSGDLASWMPRLQPFVPLAGWQMAGAIEASGSGRVSPQESEFVQTSIKIKPLLVKGPSISIDEPIGMQIETAGAWSQPKSTLTLGSTTFATSALAFRADGVRLALGKEPSLVGVIDFRGDLAKLTSWLANGPQPRTTQVAGGMTGRLELGYRGQSLAANWTADVENLVYLAAPPPAVNPRTALASGSSAPAWQSVWHEPKVNFAGQGTFDPATSTLKIERTTVAASSGSLAAAGLISKLTSGSPEVDLSGELAYDLGLVTQQIQSHAQRQAQGSTATLPYALDTLQLTGKEKRQFLLKGPLLAATGSLTPAASATRSYREDASRSAMGPSGGIGVSNALVGEASLGWQGAQYVGLVAGPADFTAKLTSGVVQVGPLDIPLAEGRLTTAPRVLLNNPVPAVVFDRGPLLQNVRISPEMCSLWLKYVAPLVAEATRAEGKFSLSLEEANVPVSAPLGSTVAGTLAIHTAQIGPGPLAQQYLGAAQQIRTLLQSGFGAGAAAATQEPDRGWLVLPQQDVQFDVREGVVHNRGLKMSVGDVVVTTEGSVAIETQQINLVASIPLQESWLQRKDNLFAGLKGQTLQIPVTGTLTQPRLDLRVLQDLGKQLAGSAVQGVIGKQLERGQGLLNKELQKGDGVLQRELGQGLNRLFGPLQPQQQPPATAPPR